MDVTADRDCVPVQWQTWLGKKPSMKLLIKYAIDAKVGPVINEWTYTSYDPADGFEQIRKAKVTQFEVNDDIDDNRFTIQFPVGTTVVEKIGKDKTRQYIQSAGGLELQSK